jgi:hypothetical protein
MESVAPDVLEPSERKLSVAGRRLNAVAEVSL